MSEYHFETVNDDVPYIYADFIIVNVTYMAIFSDDQDALSFFTDNESNSDIIKLIKDKKTYSIKFAVKEYTENGNVDLYAPPLEHKFGKTEIKKLKKHLEKLMYKHYQLFKPDCYVFIAERESLARMYNKMCCNPSDFMADFKPVVKLGRENNCFVIKTPSY